MHCVRGVVGGVYEFPNRECTQMHVVHLLVTER